MQTMNPVQPSSFGGQMAQMGTQMGSQLAANQFNPNLGMQSNLGSMPSANLAQPFAQTQQMGSQPIMSSSQPMMSSQPTMGGMSSQMMGKSAIQEGEFLSSAPSFSWYSGEKMTMTSTTTTSPLQQQTGVTEKALFSSPGLAPAPLTGPSFTSISTVPLSTTVVSSAPVVTAPLAVAPIAPIPRGTIHHVHSEKGLRGPIPGATAIGETQPLPPGVIPEHVTEELVTEMPIGMRKKTGRAARRHQDEYHRNLELARADLLKAAEYFKLGNMALHDEWVGKALLHQKEAERNLRLTYRR